MNHIEEIREIDENFFELVKENTNNVVEQIWQSHMSLTSFELMNSVAKIASLKEGIFSLADERNFYCINILHRGCIEVFLKSFYIWLMALRTNDDSFVKKYSEINAINELHTALYKKLKKCGSSQKEIYQQLGQNKQVFMKYRFKEFAKLRQEFTFGNMLEELSGDLSQKNIPIDFLHTLLSKYSELSSFVHGGPIADVQTTEFFKQPDDISDIVEISVLMFMQLWRLLIIILLQKSKNEQIVQLYNNIVKVIKKISSLS
ncbi:hypothetical protein IJ556_04485 [bacterium]|nr:hypothetical protein [bacterium]